MTFFWIGVIATVTFVAGLFLMPVLIVHVPHDYFVRERPPRLAFERRHPVLRIALLGIKNLLGAALAVAGVVMIVTPGPGLMAILAGFTLMDIPGKRAIERKLIRLPTVLTSINWLRAQYGHPPSCRRCIGSLRSIADHFNPGGRSGTSTSTVVLTSSDLRGAIDLRCASVVRLNSGVSDLLFGIHFLGQANDLVAGESQVQSCETPLAIDHTAIGCHVGGPFGT